MTTKPGVSPKPIKSPLPKMTAAQRSAQTKSEKKLRQKIIKDLGATYKPADDYIVDVAVRQMIVAERLAKVAAHTEPILIHPNGNWGMNPALTAYFQSEKVLLHTLQNLGLSRKIRKDISVADNPDIAESSDPLASLNANGSR